MFVPTIKNDRKAFFCFLENKLYIWDNLKMKKVAAIFLLSIFLFNTVGYYIAFQAVQYQIKAEVKSEIIKGLPIDKLEIVIISKNNLSKVEWFENGDEMEYNGNRYDIVKITKNETSTTYYCMNDKQEEQLFSNLDNHINTHIAANKPVKNQAAKNLEKSVVKVYFQSKQFLKFTVLELNSSKFSPVQLNYTSALLETNSPPPEFV
jgi:hypothetical protein